IRAAGQLLKGAGGIATGHGASGPDGARVVGPDVLLPGDGIGQGRTGSVLSGAVCAYADPVAVERRQRVLSERSQGGYRGDHRVHGRPVLDIPEGDPAGA